MVATLATNFDQPPPASKWSKQHFPKTFKTEMIHGTIVNLGSTPGTWRIRWHYDDDVCDMAESKLTLVEESSLTDEHEATNLEAVVAATSSLRYFCLTSQAEEPGVICPL